MSQEVRELPAYSLKTMDGRTLVFKQSVNRHGHPIVVIETYSANAEIQSTVKIGFKDIPNLRMALQTFADAMLDSMCDY